MNYERELEFARRLATAAGNQAKHIREGGVATETKLDASPVTIADRENERMVREAIEREFPDDGILGEEGSSKGGSGRPPLDYRSHRWHSRLRARKPVLVRPDCA